MAFPTEGDFAGLLARLANQLRADGLPFMVVGGQAVLLHGEPRLTQDIDLTIAATVDQLPEVLHATRGADLAPLPTDVEDFVRETFVLPVVDTATGTRVDIIFAHTDYESQAIAHAVQVDLAGTSVPFATAEDLVLHKLFAGRPRDVEDAAGIVRRKGAELDWAYIKRWAVEFSEVPGREDLPQQVASLEQQCGPQPGSA